MEVAAEWSEYARKGRAALKDRDLAAEDEFAALVERNVRRMFRVAYSLLRNSHDAEDAVQEAFLKLHRSGGWRRMEDERAFLARTVWRVALDRLPRGVEGDRDVAELEIAAKAQSPEERVADRDERELLRQMIDRLPEEL